MATGLLVVDNPVYFNYYTYTMKDLLYRFWNTVKIPLVILIIASITLIVEELQLRGDFSTILTWKFWEGTVFILVLIVLPGISATLDKYLRGEDIYVEKIFNGFKK